MIRQQTQKLFKSFGCSCLLSISQFALASIYICKRGSKQYAFEDFLFDNCQCIFKKGILLSGVPNIDSCRLCMSISRRSISAAAQASVIKFVLRRFVYHKRPQHSSKPKTNKGKTQNTIQRFVVSSANKREREREKNSLQFF